MRLRLHIAYDGSAFQGWQIQPEAPTIEGALTEAAATILDRPADAIKIQGASRTDSGVHADGQVAHLDCERDRGLWELAHGLNSLTPHAICVNRIEPAPEDFHARFSARGKIYRYTIWNHQFPHPHRHHRTWKISWQLDLDRMRRAADRMVDAHDFAAFRPSDGQSPTTDRTMRRVEVAADGPEWTITVEGDAFLKYMVRVMVGTLVDVASGTEAPEVVDELFETGDRDRAGVTAPGEGLSLLEVHYPDFPWKAPPPAIGGQVLPHEQDNEAES
ncbi:MAG: tRNA pseudouridine(38-40) synthase TruA [Bradymonadaceae bacterium]